MRQVVAKTKTSAFGFAVIKIVELSNDANHSDLTCKYIIVFTKSKLTSLRGDRLAFCMERVSYPHPKPCWTTWHIVNQQIIQANWVKMTGLKSI